MKNKNSNRTLLFNWSCPWRRGQDLNLRSLLGDTRFPSEHHKPLGHLSLLNFYLEQVAGIEPATYAWEAHVLPLNYTCIWRRRWDSNPRADCSTTAFRVRLSTTALIRLQVVLLYCKPKQKSIVIRKFIKTAWFFLIFNIYYVLFSKFEHNLITWKVGWAVESSGLENRRSESYLGFESLTFRQLKPKPRISV